MKKNMQHLHAVTSFPDDGQPNSLNTTLHDFLPFFIKSMEKELADPDYSTDEDYSNALEWALRALANRLWSFGEVSVSNGHTIKKVTYFHHNFSKDLVFEVPMDSVPETSILHYFFRGAEWLGRNTPRIELDEGFRRRIPGSSIVVQTVVVRFKIGRLRSAEPNDEDCTAMFQLLDEEENCVGEIITTGRVRREAEGRPVDFLSISWGFGLQAAKIPRSRIPKWPFASRTAQEISRIEKQRAAKYLCRMFGGDLISNNMGFLQDLGANGTNNSGSVLQQILMAKKGDDLPKELWAVVNIMSVSWEGQARQVARRTGIGRVVFKVWEEQASMNGTQKVILQ